MELIQSKKLLRPKSRRDVISIRKIIKQAPSNPEGVIVGYDRKQTALISGVSA
jgi:hypothetical protein